VSAWGPTLVSGQPAQVHPAGPEPARRITQAIVLDDASRDVGTAIAEL
jgi:hypothetical protein